MNDLEHDLARHFDDLAADAPDADPSAVASARTSGERLRRRRALGIGSGALALGLGTMLVLTQLSGDVSSDDSLRSDPLPTTAVESSPGANAAAAGTAWDRLAPSGGALEVERYATIVELFSAAPLVVHGSVSAVELGPVIDDPQSDEAYRDIFLTLTPSDSGEAATPAPVTVQLGPFFGREASDWVTSMSSGPGAVIGDETLWALRARADGPTYRPLTSDSVFVRTGDRVLTPLAAGTSIERQSRSTSWAQLLQAAGITE